MTERFETPPGVQSQFDWSEYTVPLGSALTRVVVYGLILSSSRAALLGQPRRHPGLHL